MSSLRRLAALGVLVVVAACASPQPSKAPPPKASIAPPASVPPGLEGCPSFDPGVVDERFLSDPLPAPADGFVAQVLVAPETGEANLGGLPRLLATEIRGAAPVEDPDWRAGALEASAGEGCRLRVLVDESVLETWTKEAPLWLQLTMPAASLTFGGEAAAPASCTWLTLAQATSAAIECMSLPSDPPVTGPVRMWIRMAWSAPVTAAGSMPDWAVTALASPAPGASSAPGASPPTAFGLVPAGPETAFALTDPPLPDGSSLEMRTVARGPGGWVAAGSYQPLSAGDQMSSADAPVWFSPDGRTWERVGIGDPDLGGPGYQWIVDVAATPAGWWALGTSVVSVEGERAARLWSSADGRSWDAVTLDPCTLDVCPGALDSARLRALPDGSLLLVGDAAGDAAASAWWRLQGARLVAGGMLPRAGDIPTDQQLLWHAVNDGADGWVVIATVATQDGTRMLAWRSPDGATWTQVTDGRTEALERMDWVADVEIAGDRWIVVGAPGLALIDPGDATFPDETSWLNAVVRVDDGYVVVGSGDVGSAVGPVARWSADGLAWVDIPIEGGPREPDRNLVGAAFDDGALVVVGTRGANAMAWHSVAARP